MVSTGAFYTYVAKGLGKPVGVAAAFTAALAYVVYTIGLAAFLGYFADLVLADGDIGEGVQVDVSFGAVDAGDAMHRSSCQLSIRDPRSARRRMRQQRLTRPSIEKCFDDSTRE